MTANKVKAWLISLLGSTTAITSLLPKGSDSVRSSDLDVPSERGVYVRVLSSAPAGVRGSDSVEVRITVVMIGETETYAVLDAVRTAIFRPAGSPGSFAVSPASMSLTLSSVSQAALQVAPEAIGEDNSYAGVLSVTVIGRDATGPD